MLSQVDGGRGALLPKEPSIDGSVDRGEDGRSAEAGRKLARMTKLAELNSTVEGDDEEGGAKVKDERGPRGESSKREMK